MKLFLIFVVAVSLYGVAFMVFISTNQVSLETDDLFESFHPEWHPQTREDRFPSVEHRVKVYMSSWYLPPCPNDRWINYEHSVGVNMTPILKVTTGSGEEVKIVGDIKPDTEILLERDVVEDCARSLTKYRIDHWLNKSPVTEERVHVRRNMRGFCGDILEIFDYTENETISTPLVAMFGDESSHHDLPIFSKWRWAASRSYVKGVTERDECWDSSVAIGTYAVKENTPLPPILWKLGTVRHWNPIEMARPADTDWVRKKPKAVWRGSFTGKGPESNLSEEERCWVSLRCRFVYKYASSKVIDAGFVNLKDRINSRFKGVRLKKAAMSMTQMQQHKVIVSLEGNDVASGLKWNLASQSVVLMPPPTKTSWAMEELLEPWVHYVPLDANGSNAEEMVQWILNNDNEARKIAERATLFIYDMLFHPDAEADEAEVKQEILERYKRHWV